MKKLGLSWAALSLLPPLLILFSVLFGSVGHFSRLVSFAANSTPKAGATSGNIQVGFVSNITGVPPSGIQSLRLNVIAVRLSPKPKPGSGQGIPGENDPSWVAIPVPSGIGIGLNGKPGDLQVDLLAGQSKYQSFNTGPVRVNTYNSVEILLDTRVTGSVVPVCSSGVGQIEGCAEFPFSLNSPGNQISFVANNPVVVAKNTLGQVLLQLNLNITQKPSAPPGGIGGFYAGDITIAPASGSGFLATVTGSVTGGVVANPNQKKVRHLQVAAMLPGTNTIVSTANVVGSSFTMFLPAAADIGTLYDFAISGGAATFGAQRGVPSGTGAPLVFPGDMYALNDFSPSPNQKLGTMAGKITDQCTNLPIPGATLNLLQEPDGTGVDCTTSPSECVVVASTTTDNGGVYPLPGTFKQPAYFNNLPIGPTFTIQVMAPGYDPLIFQGQASVSTTNNPGGICSSSSDAPKCDFALSTSYIAGTVALTSAPVNSGTNVQVFAEDTGTNNLISALPMPLQFKAGQSSMNFSLNVPSQPGNFDLFASATDLFMGVTDPYGGHTILTQADVPGAGTACATAVPAPTASPFTLTMNCVGHGSITGTVTNPDSGTSVELSKNGVQLMQATVGPPTPAPTPGNAYSFCVPPDDTYSVQRLELDQSNTPLPTTTAVGASATVTAMPIPSATGSPACPTTCQSAAGSCPGLCSNTIQPPL